MVQAGPTFDYDENVEQEPQPQQKGWTESLRDAVREFVESVSESSKQLASAAERFAGESLHVMDDAASKARESANSTSELAETARRSAEEARQAAESLQEMVAAASERIKTEAQQALAEAVSRAEQARASAETIQSDIEARVDAALERISAVAAGNESSASVSEELLQQVHAIEERLETLQASGSQTEQFAASIESIRQQIDERFMETTERLEAGLAQSQQAASDAQKAAEEARQAASEIETRLQQSQGISEPAIGPQATEILERLEADYQLLTNLVQELNTRMTVLSLASHPMESQPATEPLTPSPTEATTATEEPPPPPAETWVPVGSEEAAASFPETNVAPSQAEVVEAAWQITPEEQAPPSETPSSPTLDGRIMVLVSPVPDFDRLLNLDGALGRLSGVRNVTLADYAKEEVTFRVELDGALAVDEFARRLGEAAGQQIEVTFANESNVSLRLVV